MEGGGLGLPPVGGDGGQVHLVGGGGLLVQGQADTHNIHGGAHLPAGHVAVVDGQYGVGGHPHVVNQRLTGGAEHLGDPPGGAVQKFKSLVAGHDSQLLSGICPGWGARPIIALFPGKDKPRSLGWRLGMGGAGRALTLPPGCGKIGEERAQPPGERPQSGTPRFEF